MLGTCFPCEMLEFWYVRSRSAHVTSPQLKSLNFLGISVIDNTFHVLSLLVRGLKHHLCYSTGRRLLEALYLIFFNFTPCIFFFACFVLCPFAGTKLSCEYDSTLSSVILLCESPNLGVVLRTLTQVLIQSFLCSLHGNIFFYSSFLIFL